MPQIIESAPENAFSVSLSGIRLGEFDLGGVLYHANYFHIYEQLREALLQDIQVPYPGLVEKGFHLAVVESHQRFLRPIFYGQALKAELWVSELRRTSLRFCYSIRAEAGEKSILHSAWTRHVFVSNNHSGFKQSSLPENLCKGLLRYSATV